MTGKVILLVLLAIGFYFLITPRSLALIQNKIRLIIRVYSPYLKQKLKQLFTKKV
jgi:hypothetical protein